MDTLRLIPIGPEYEAELSRDDTYRQAMQREDWPAVAQCVQRILGNETHLQDTPEPNEPPHHGGFVALNVQLNELVGSCAFKAPPNEQGDIEIAYFSYPGHEGRGYASAMAVRLVELAAHDPAVRHVIAHTLPEANASTRVLTKAGFTHAGDTIDPDDGPVWRWQRPARP
ncbi:MAG: GNAT family N-acetyltransferase [Planctomycetota bacterium]